MKKLTLFTLLFCISISFTQFTYAPLWILKPLASITPKLELHSSPWGGYAVYVKAPIQKDEVLALYGSTPLGKDALRHRSPENDEIITPVMYQNITNYIYHSCTPNARFIEENLLIALQNILIDEVISCNYAEALSTNIGVSDFKCDCGPLDCVGFRATDEWEKKKLKETSNGACTIYFPEE